MWIEFIYNDEVVLGPVEHDRIPQKGETLSVDGKIYTITSDVVNVMRPHPARSESKILVARISVNTNKPKKERQSVRE